MCKHRNLVRFPKFNPKVFCFSRLLTCLRSLCVKQCGPRSDCSYRSSLFFWVHAVCFFTYFVSNVRKLFAADDFSRRHFQMHFFLDSLRFKLLDISCGKYHEMLDSRPEGHGFEPHRCHCVVVLEQGTFILA